MKKAKKPESWETSSPSERQSYEKKTLKTLAKKSKEGDPMEEEVSFSEAELLHIESILGEALPVDQGKAKQTRMTLSGNDRVAGNETPERDLTNEAKKEEKGKEEDPSGNLPYKLGKAKGGNSQKHTFPDGKTVTITPQMGRDYDRAMEAVPNRSRNEVHDKIHQSAEHLYRFLKGN